MPSRTQQSGDTVSSVPWGSGTIATMLSCAAVVHVSPSPPRAAKLRGGLNFILVTLSPLLGLV